MLSVAIDELIPSKLLSKIFEKFGQTFPETDLEIFMGVMRDVGEMVKSGRTHVGIELPEGSPPTAGCNWRLLGRMDFVFVTAKSHPLAKMKRITPDDLSPYRQLVTINRGGQLEYDAQFGDRCWMCESSRVIRDLMLRGQGWGVVAHYQVKGDLAAGRLVRLPVTF